MKKPGLEKILIITVLIIYAVLFSRHYIICYAAVNTVGSLLTGNSGTSNIVTDETGLSYETDSSTYTCKVISYSGNSSDVIIPDVYGEYTVTAVAGNAFRENGTIKTIVIGNNVKKLGAGAFAFCDFLYQAVIPESVIKYGSNLFYGCRKNRFTIVTPGGSEAEKFAVKNGFLVTDTTQARLSVKNINDIVNHQEKIYVYNSPSKVLWKSHNKKIAEVDASGKITALKPGTTVITAKIKEKTLECRVKVLKRNRKNCLKVIYSKYVKKQMSDYEKIYAAHEWLIKNVKYDKRLYTKGKIPMVSHTAKGVFDYGTAVCDGYSKAFMVIMKHYRIPCMMVTGMSSGTGHAWNMVKIKNKWYHIDCTYDDPVVNGRFNNKTVYMDFFLKTDEYMYNTHVWDYDAFPVCSSKKADKKYSTKKVPHVELFYCALRRNFL